MSRIQDNVNKMFKEKEHQDLLVDSIISQRRNDFDEFLENQKNNVIWTKEETEYINSIYYPEYLKCLGYLEKYADNLYSQMLYTYEFNRINFNDAFFRGIHSTINITGIGFQIPKKFVIQIKDTVQKYLSEKSTIDDGAFEVSVLPAEYTMVGSHDNIGKPTYSYQIHVDLKRKLIQKKQK